MTVVVGGTFNIFHAGHRRLLDEAIAVAAFKRCSLVIGITTDEFARSTRSVKVRPYEERMHDVQRYVEDDDLRPHFGPTYYLRIESADDMPEMGEKDTLVVSEETAGNAYRILAEKDYGCEVRVVDMVCDENGNEIHSTNILRRMMT